MKKTQKMQKMMKGQSVITAILAIAAIAMALVLIPNLTADQATRQIVIVAKDMAFTAPGQPNGDQINPTIILAPGERVSIVLRNEDRGMRHDFVIEELGLATAVLSAGNSATLTFTAPLKKGVYTYLCTLHAWTMRGRIVVQ